MYNPEVMKQAQEMMSKMTPAQREKMMEMQRNMSPEMLQAAQRNMASMNPDMMKQAMQGGNFERSLEQMEKMSPEEMERRTAMAAAMGGGASAPAPPPTPPKPSTDPAVVKAVKLKETGTGLLKNKDLDGARAQYAAAVEALEEATDTEGKRPVWAACQLNMAHVFLEQQNWKRAAAVCDLVIDSSSAMADPATKLKAHYRRGRARKGLEKFAEAAADLQVAQTMAPPAQLPPIQALLAQVKASLPSSGGGDSNSSSSDGAAIPRGKGGARIEEITEDDEEGASSSSTGATSSSSSSSATPGGVPNMGSMAQQMANMNPEVMKQQMEMMDKMDDAQLEQMAKMQASMRPGMPVMSAAQMRSQMSMMVSLRQLRTHTRASEAALTKAVTIRRLCDDACRKIWTPR
jgi:tetratricopeptide (TPR) repeat protein